MGLYGWCIKTPKEHIRHAKATFIRTLCSKSHIRRHIRVWFQDPETGYRLVTPEDYEFLESIFKSAPELIYESALTWDDERGDKQRFGFCVTIER